MFRSQSTIRQRIDAWESTVTCVTLNALAFDGKQFGDNKKLIKWLVAKQASDGNTLLHMACENQDSPLSTIEWLIANGASATSRNAAGDMPLHVIVRFHHNRKDAVKLLFVSAGPSAINEANAVGDTALHECGRVGLGALFVQLIEAGGDPLRRNARNRTPIHELVKSNMSANKKMRRELHLLRKLAENPAPVADVALLPPPPPAVSLPPAPRASSTSSPAPLSPLLMRGRGDSIMGSQRPALLQTIMTSPPPPPPPRTPPVVSSACVDDLAVGIESVAPVSNGVSKAMRRLPSTPVLSRSEPLDPITRLPVGTRAPLSRLKLSAQGLSKTLPRRSASDLKSPRAMHVERMQNSDSGQMQSALVSAISSRRLSMRKPPAETSTSKDDDGDDDWEGWDMSRQD